MGLLNAIVFIVEKFQFPSNLSWSSLKTLNFASLLKVDSWNSILETRFFKLKPQNSVLNSQNYRGLRFEFQVEIVNLPLTGTVCV